MHPIDTSYYYILSIHPIVTAYQFALLLIRVTISFGALLNHILNPHLHNPPINLYSPYQEIIEKEPEEIPEFIIHPDAKPLYKRRPKKSTKPISTVDGKQRRDRTLDEQKMQNQFAQLMLIDRRRKVQAEAGRIECELLSLDIAHQHTLLSHTI